MTRPPFGFGPSDRPDDPDGPRQPQDPFGLGGLLGGDVFSALQKMMSWTGGPVNWDLAHEVATGATRSSDRPVTAEESAQVTEACRLADLWLDPVTALPGTGAPAAAWTRTGWVESTLPAWRSLIDPVATQVVAAMTRAVEKTLGGDGLGQQLAGLPPEVAGLLGGLTSGGGLGPLQGMLDQLGGMVFGAQVGQGLAVLAGEVVSLSEVGLPLGRSGQSALLPANVAAFREGLEVPEDEVRLYLALREAAHQRLFAAVPWLRAHLFDAVEAYARGIDVDVEAIERAVGELDPTDLEGMQQALSGGLFDVQPTAAQQAALGRLETALALVEGWVDTVVDAAATPTLPSAGALRETVRRRRASGGPAEQTFAALIGLNLRPRRLREAAQLWAELGAARGLEGRDGLWKHPDLLPTADDLDDPVGFAVPGDGRGSDEQATSTDWDAELRKLGSDGDDGPAPERAPE